MHLVTFAWQLELIKLYACCPFVADISFIVKTDIQPTKISSYFFLPYKESKMVQIFFFCLCIQYYLYAVAFWDLRNLILYVCVCACVYVCICMNAFLSLFFWWWMLTYNYCVGLHIGSSYGRFLCHCKYLILFWWSFIWISLYMCNFSKCCICFPNAGFYFFVCIEVVDEIVWNLALMDWFVIDKLV